MQTRDEIQNVIIQEMDQSENLKVITHEANRNWDKVVRWDKQRQR